MANEMSADECDDVVQDNTKDKTKDPQWKLKLKLIKDIRESVKTVESGKNKLNVAVIGNTGCGKSTFINTILTSFRKDKWQQYAKAGMNKGKISSITRLFTSFSAEESYYKEEPDVLLPTFIDINGLEDEHVEFNKVFLRALFEGKIKEKEKITDLRKEHTTNPDVFENKIFKRTEYLKINRIIVVLTSDPDVIIPTELFKCINEVATDLKGIPIFGVMTKKDKFEGNEEIPQRTINFLGSLGITQESFMWVENYCPDTDPNMEYRRTVYPRIDVPVLEFINQVTNPHLGQSEEWHGFLTRILLKFVKWVCIPIQIIIWAYVLILFTFMLYHDYNKILSTANNTRNNRYEFTLPNIGLIYHVYRFFRLPFVIAPIAVSLFLFILSYIVKNLVRIFVTKLLLAITIFIILPILLYIYKNQITHWLS